MAYIELPLSPVAIPPVQNRPRYLLKWFLLVVLWGGFFAAMGTLLMASVSPPGRLMSWSEILGYNLVMGVIFGPIMPYMHHVLGGRSKRWKGAATQVYAREVEQARDRVWHVLGAQLNDSTWTIDCYSGKILSSIRVPASQVTLRQGSTAAPTIRFHEIDFKLRYVAGPALLYFDGDVDLNLPDGVTPPPIQDEYWPCPNDRSSS